MSVIIRLQNLPWSANALDIRNFFRGLSIPEGGVHIVGGELGDAFIAFSTDEDARQAMMLDGGKIKEIQVKLHLSSRSEMHKVIETARQSVSIMTLAPAPAPIPAPVPAPIPAAPPAPSIQPIVNPFTAALGNNINNYGIPGLGNPQEVPQPAVIELPSSHVSPNDNSNPEDEKDDEKVEKRRDRRRTRSRTRSRSRDRERKDRKRDRRDRSRSRERRRRDRSRSREGRRDRKRNNRSRSRDRSATRRSRDRRKSPSHSQEKDDSPVREVPLNPMKPFGNQSNLPPQVHQMLQGNMNSPASQDSPRYNDPAAAEALNKMQELAKKRNPNAFQGDQNGSKSQTSNRNSGRPFQRERRSRFTDESTRDCCVAIRDAPNHTSYGDVRRFFPFMIDKHGIKMINDATGRRTGNIFVRFTEPRSKQLALQRKNNELKGGQVTVEDLDDEAYEAAVDSFLPFRADNDVDADVIFTEAEADARTFTALKLSDMPHYIKEHDIIKAFNDYSLLSITLIDCRVSRSKVALVQFAKTEEAKAAYERRERIAFNRRHPTITPLSNEEFEKERLAAAPKNDSFGVPPPSVESQPEPAAPRDPRQRRQFDGPAPVQQQGSNFFVPFAQNFPGAQSPAFPVGQNNAFPGGQNAAFPGGQNPVFPGGQNPAFPVGQNNAFPGGQNAAFPGAQNPGFPGQPQGFPGAQFPGPQFGGFPGPANVDPRTAASNWANRPQLEPRASAPQRPSFEDEPLDCVLMKGLPRDATDRTIVNFLADTGAVPARIHLMLDAAGAPSGDCFCEFRSPQEARQAAAKHGRNLEGCRVTVDLVPRSVVEEALEGPKQPDNPPEGLLGNGPPQFFDNTMGRGGFNGRGGFDSSRGFRGRGGFDRGGFGNRGGFDSSRGFRGRGGFDRGARGFEGRGRGRGRGAGFDNGRSDDADPPEDFGAPGCVVSMENVPFRATIDEILQFFSEFELTQDDVIRRYNERGQPTGDARVAFRTPFDAQRAVKTRHMDTIHERRINLNIL